MTDRRLTVPEFVARKRSGPPLTVVTAYDYPSASIVEAGGADAILIGDTVGVVVAGHETTLPVTLAEMVYHTRMVARASRRALLVADMPFASYQSGRRDAIRSASRLLKQGACQAVKLEGGAEQASVIAALVDAGIPVMAHIGVRPQSVHQMGGYRAKRDADPLLADARAAEDAGAFAIVLECVTASIGAAITEALAIPTIGIGAGVDCDGQVLVFHDLVGLTTGPAPRFVKRYADGHRLMTEAVATYVREVQTRQFPDAAHSYK